MEGIQLVQQFCTMASVTFDDAAVADFFDDQVAAGRRPEQFARIWIHTHPGDSAAPSQVDERTFRRVFGRCDWSVMFILARGGQTYARLQYSVGPGGTWEIPVEIDFASPFAGTDLQTWEAEYTGAVRPVELLLPNSPAVSAPSGHGASSLANYVRRDDPFCDSALYERTFHDLERSL